MKKEQRKPTTWLMGGLAALIFLGSGSMAAAQVVTSYNDLASGSTPPQLTNNITTFTSPAGGSGFLASGPLKDFDTGLDTPVNLAVTGGTYDGDANHATQGANPTMGSDAFDAFDGKVDGVGAVSYIDAMGADLVLTFTGMDPNKVYDLTFYAHRNDFDWDRASLVTISGTDLSNTAFVNTSSVASDNPDTGTYPGGVLFTAPTSPSTRLPSDNDLGYVARFSNIKSGMDGTVVLTISFDGNMASQYKGKYASALRLIESGNTTNDVDGDGKADLVWRNTATGDVAVWLGDGVTPVTTTGVIGNAPLATWALKDNGDMDMDGKADLVWRNTTTGDVAVWLGDGVTPVTTTGVIGNAPLATWSLAGIGDMDMDGKADLVWRNTATGDVAVWLGDGVTPVTTTGVIGNAPLATWSLAGIGDTDNDGKADLVWRNTATGDVAVWLGDGVTPVTTTGVIGNAPLATWSLAGIGDTDNDGKADLVWRNTATGDVAVWLGDGVTPVTTTGVIGNAPLATWSIADIGDTDEDGKADLVWRNMNDGSVAVWLGDGVTPVTTTGVIGGASLVWEIQP